MKLELLREPFAESDIEWRLAQCGESNGKIWGMCLAYIQARAVMDRLDEVCGPENWKVTYEILGNGMMCTLSIRSDDQWIYKQDGAESTDVEPFKGGISSALKRAGSVWGIGRYLYNLETNFITICDRTTQGARYGKTKDGKVFHWLPPKLPDWALPKKPAPTPALAINPPIGEDMTDYSEPEDLPFGVAAATFVAPTPSIGAQLAQEPPFTGGPPPRVISEPQVKRLYAIIQDRGWTELEAKELCEKHYKITSFRSLNSAQYKFVCETILSLKR